MGNNCLRLFCFYAKVCEVHFYVLEIQNVATMNCDICF